MKIKELSPFKITGLVTSNTYILKSNEYYKIGKADNVEERFKQLQTGNPTIELIKTIKGNYESFLHKHFKSKLHTREWYLLTEEDLLSIDDLILNVKPIYFDKRSYINVSHQSFFLIKDFSASTVALFSYILSALERNKDYVIINPEDFKQYANYKETSKASYYNAINELIDNHFIANSPEQNKFWINTSRFYRDK